MINRIRMFNIEFKKATSEMTGREKISYFFDYYKWHSLIFLIILLVIIGIGNAVFQNSGSVLLSYAVLNSTKNEINTSFHADYAAFCGAEGRYRFESMTALYIDNEYFKQHSKAIITGTGSDYTTLSTSCGYNMLDVIITDRKGVLFLSENDLILPLNEYLPKKQAENLSDRILQFRDSTQTTYPFALDISDTTFAKGLQLEYSEVFLVFPGATEQNREHALRFLEYLFQNEAPYAS